MHEERRVDKGGVVRFQQDEVSLRIDGGFDDIGVFGSL
jgi:hypothetical protein